MSVNLRGRTFVLPRIIEQGGLMKKILIITALVIMVCALVYLFMTFFASSAHASNNEPRKTIDLNKTLKFIQGWSSRDKWDKFPESPSFAYYNVYSAKALKSDIGPELRKKIIDYLKSCQMKGGGF